MEIIKRGEIIPSPWIHLDDHEALADDHTHVSVSLARFERESATLNAHPAQVAVRLHPSDELDALVPRLGDLPLVIIEFPKFSDGRGYSLARLLRDRYGYQGELRAVGNILRDQLYYLHRCGFDAFELQPGKSITEALDAFNDFSVRYQASSDEARPLYRRRAFAP